MIKKTVIRGCIDLMRNAVRSIFLVTAILLSLFICWFVFYFLAYLMDYCNATIFSDAWY